MDNVSLFFLIFGLNNQSQLADLLMIFGAEFLIYLMLILAFILAVRGKIPERKSLILFLISFPILVLLIKFIHLFLFEPRPYITNNILPLITHKEADASFPSRHASIMSAIAFAYWYYKSRWTPLFLLSLIWVGIARIYVGVHYPIDILGGIIFGITSLLISRQIIRLIKGRLSLN